MLKKKLLSIVTALALTLPMFVAPINSYAYRRIEDSSFSDKYAQVKELTDINDEFVSEFKQKEQMDLISPYKKDEEKATYIYENISNIERLKEIKNLKRLGLWAGITQDELKYLVKNLKNLEDIIFSTNEVIDVGNIKEEIEASNIKYIRQNIYTKISSDTLDNPVKFAGEYLELPPFAEIKGPNGYRAVLDNSDKSKIRIKDFDKLKKYAGKNLEINLGKKMNDVMYHIRIAGYIPEASEIQHTIKIEGGTSDKTTAKQGEIVNITADKLKDTKKFDKWTSDDVTISNPTLAKTSFTMIDKDVNIVANYKDYTPIQDIKITTDNILMTTLTTDVQLQVTPVNNDDELTWTSSNKNVATVDSKGQITARAKGQCEITVTTLTNKKASVKLKVETKNIPSSSSDDEDSNANNNSSSGGGGGGSAPQKAKEEVKKEVKEEVKKEENANEKIQEKEITVKDIMTNEKAEEKVSNLKDVSEITWSKQAITKVIQKGIMQGDTNGNFNPKANITRAEVSQVIANIIGEKVQKNIDIKDVQKDKWYNDAVQTVLEKGIFVKDNDGKFNPENKITRAELFTVIGRLKNIKQLDKEQTDEILSSYKDGSSVPTWARGYVAALIEKGIVKGSDNNINANEALTRQELATIFANIID